jgi:type I restriction enzyme, S subunit
VKLSKIKTIDYEKLKNNEELKFVKLSEIASKAKYSIVDGPFGSNLKSSDYVSNGIPVLQGKNISNNKFVFSDIRFISLEKAEKLKRSKVVVGDILLIKIGSIGYAAEIDDLKGYPYAIIPANIAKITIDENRIKKFFFLNWLHTDSVKRYLQNIASKTAQPALSLKKIKELPIFLPPLKEQERITDILNLANNLINLRKQTTRKINELAQSIFIDTFGSTKKNPKKFPVKKLKEIIKFQGGSQPSKSFFSYEPSDENIRLVQIRDFRTDKFKTYIPKKIAKRFFNIEDVMIGRYGPPVFQIFRGLKGSYNVALMKASPLNLITRDFIFYLLQEHDLHSFVVANSERTAGQSGVNLDLLENYIAYHPPIKLQESFSDKLLIYENLKEKNIKSYNSINNFLASIRGQLFGIS